MNQRNIHIVQEQGHASHEEESHPLEMIDLDKIRQVALRGLPWVILIFMFCSTLGWLYLRYTKPVYSSESVLKLDLKNDALVLGIQNPIENDIKGLSGEIELLKSRLFFSQVADAINMEVSYYSPGRSHLVDEKYGNSPFIVYYKFVSPELFDQRINLEILSASSFRLDLPGIEEEQLRFGDPIKTDKVDIVISKTRHFESQKNVSNFYFVINSKESIISYLEKNVTVQPLNFNANTIKISLSDPNKYKARSLVQAIDTIYLAYSKKTKNQASEQKIAFLEQQMAKTASELETYESYFEDFTLEHRTTDLSKDLSQTILLLNQLDSQRFMIRNQLTYLEQFSKQVDKDQLLATPVGLPQNITQFINAYNELIKERELKTANYKENTQVIQNLNRQIEVAKSATSSAINSYEENLIVRQESLRQRRSALENNFESLPSMGTSYNKTRRLYSLQEEFYFSLIRTKIELEISKAGTVTNFVVLSPASFPVEPIHPKKWMTYGIALAAGLALSIAFLSISYLVHDKISSQKELEKIVNAPVLGAVPKYKGEKLESTRLVVSANPKSAISESLRAIRTNMDFLAKGYENQVVSITSTVSGEGKTFIAVNLGAIFAYSGKKVVIVDMDMRKPKVHQAFQVDKVENGVSTILIGKTTIEECVQKSDLENLSFIPAGTTPPNPSELILGKNYTEMIRELRTNFDIIILDTPPVGMVTDGILVMKKSDLPIYVFRSEYSRRSYAKSAKQLISHNRFHHLSLVLNSLRTSGHYGYGYGYEQQSGYFEEKSSKTIFPFDWFKKRA